jgi:hypothetical protein
LIDFIEFTDEMTAEIAPEGSAPGGSASSLKTAKK